MLAPELNPVTGLSKTRAPLASGSFSTPSVGGSPVLRPAAPAAPLASGSFATPVVNGSPVLTPAVTAPATPPPLDYQGQITADPIYQQTQADISSARTADQARLDQARQRAVIDFGALPDLSQYGSLTGDLSGSLSDLIGQLAGQNTAAGLSTTARINKAHDDAVAASKANLTARGLLSSGETGYQLGQQDLSYRQSQSDAVRALLDGLSGLQNSYLSAEAQRKASLAQAASDAAGRIQIPAAPIAPAATVPGGGSASVPPGLTPPDVTSPLNPNGNVVNYDPALDAAAAQIAASYDGSTYTNPGDFNAGDWTGTPADISSPVSPDGNVSVYNPGQAGLPQAPAPDPPRSIGDIASEFAGTIANPATPKPKPKPKPAGASSVNNKIKGQGL